MRTQLAKMHSATSRYAAQSPMVRAIASTYRRSCFLGDKTCRELAAIDLRKEVRSKLNLSLNNSQAIKLLTQ